MEKKQKLMKYEIFFQKIKKFKDEQNKQKQRGLNDYNMVNVVRKETHEVGMHSNIIYSLINPDGLHYQEDLFLNIFIDKVLDIKDFGQVIQVRAEENTTEKKRIDFTIKSDKYYIGIEMKINHHDSKNQLFDYYNDLIEKAKNDNHQKVIIYYLSKNGKEASTYSHQGIDYIKISFDKHILNWINASQNEVKNITNLNEAFENYKQIVQKITNKYQSKVMQMDKFLQTNISFLDETFELKNNIHKMLGNLLLQLFKNIDDYMNKNYSRFEKVTKDKLENKHENLYNEEKCSNVFYNNENLKGLNKTQYIGTFYRLTDTILLRVELATQHLHIGLISYCKKNEKYEISNIASDLEAIIKDNSLNLKRRSWSGCTTWYSIDCNNFISPDDINKKCYKDFENCHLINKIESLIKFVEDQTK